MRVISSYPAIAFFDNLPARALPALQSAFDRLQAGGFSNQFIFDGLARDLNEMGHPGPERGEFEAWRKGVMAGAFNRPGAKPDPIPGDMSEDDAATLKATMAHDRPKATILDTAFLPIRATDFNGGNGVVTVSGGHVADRSRQAPSLLTDEALKGMTTAALEALKTRLIAEAKDELEPEFSKMSRQHAAKRLRRMADELERGISA